MKRPWQIMLAFALCLAVVLAAMGWASLQVLRLDRAEAEAKCVAGQEENVRLALWRMEAALAPLLAQEMARPVQDYWAFHAAPTHGKGKGAQTKGEPAVPPMLPSPLLFAQRSPLVRLYFQVDEAGRFTSPQAPAGTDNEKAERAGVAEEEVAAAETMLADLTGRVSRADLESALSLASEALTAEVLRLSSLAVNTGRQNQVPLYHGEGQLADAQTAAPPQQKYQQETVQQQAGQKWRNDAEFNARAQRVVTANPDNYWMLGNTLFLDEAASAGLRASWVGRELFLLRRLDAGKRACLQGVWLDWPALRQWLLEGVADLVPNADLVPVRPGGEAASAGLARRPASSTASDGGAGAEARGRLLASLPARLVPGEIAALPAAGLSPLVLSLVVAWICVLVAAGAVAGLLLGTVALSERRGDFVSAVTHELRTPLTTFRMYSEMLAEGMVTDEAKRRRYLQTLRVEAERLSHLVENVLAYARLERGRARGRVESVTLANLVGHVQERLADRARQAGMTLVVECLAASQRRARAVEGEPDATTALADASAVEQILFNLVDNACKYAATAQDRRIHLVADGGEGRAVLKVCDHGPGISPGDAARLFRPFSKSARQAAHSAPGVGLGLALSRRLARDMGGDLTYEPRPGDEACFVLELKRASSARG